jgi:hypothetical protein
LLIPVIHEPRNDERQLPLNSLARDIKDLPIEEWVTGLRRMQHLVKRLAWLACFDAWTCICKAVIPEPKIFRCNLQLRNAIQEISADGVVV